MERIFEFKGLYRFLSNFWPCQIEYEGYVYPSVEHAYQASKTLVDADRERIRNAERPGKAKALGKRVYVRPDWEKLKLSIMKDLVRQKFKDDFHLKRFLLATEDDILEEGNNWGDTFWGIDLRTGNGKNHLGKILMHIRYELLNE